MKVMQKIVSLTISCTLVLTLFTGCGAPKGASSGSTSSESTMSEASGSSSSESSSSESSSSQASGSSSSEQSSSSQSSTKGKKIGLVLSTLNNPFYLAIKNSAEKKAKEMGYSIIVADSQNNTSKEASNIEDMVTQKVSALIINPIDSDSPVSSIKAANQKKIPVITLDRAVNGGEIMAHITSDNFAGGKMAADFIIGQLKGKGKVVILEGTAGSSSSLERSKGFENQIATSNEIKIVAKQAADFDRAKALSAMEKIMKSQTEVKAIFAENDEMALGAVKALESAKKKGVIVVGFDGSAEAVAAVKAGTMAATIAQQPEIIGSMAIELADKVIKKQKISKTVPAELKLVTK